MAGRRSSWTVRGADGETYAGFWPAPLTYASVLRDARGRVLARDRARPHGLTDPVQRIDELAFAKPAGHTVAGPVEPPLFVELQAEHPLLGDLIRRRKPGREVPGTDDVLTGDD